jgi:hypothetical protein
MQKSGNVAFQKLPVFDPINEKESCLTLSNAALLGGNSRLIEKLLPHFSPMGKLSAAAEIKTGPVEHLFGHA